MKNHIFKRLILFFIGMTIIQFGVALFLKTNIGSDPFTVFNQGLAFLLNITPGQANMIILAVLICIILLVNRKYINIGTVICVIGVGPIIDLSLMIAGYIPIESCSLIVKSIFLIVISFVIAVGFSILKSADLGVAPNDNMYFIIRDKFRIQFKYARMGMDLGFLIIGYILGGVFGIGTIISALVTGPFVQFCMPYGEKLAHVVMGDKEANENDVKA